MLVIDERYVWRDARSGALRHVEIELVVRVNRTLGRRNRKP
jgi:hypothetical protein